MKEEKFYYNKGVKIPLIKSKTKKAIKSESKTDEEKKKNETVFEASAGQYGMTLGDDIYIVSGQDVPEGKSEFESVQQNIKGKELNVYEKENVETAILSDQFIIKFKKDTPKKERNKIIKSKKYDFKELKFNRYLLTLKDWSDYDGMLETINSLFKDNDFVEYAHPNFKRIMKKQSFPRDPEFTKQWALNKNGFDINVKKVWERGVKGEGITIAIIDDGVDYSHEDFQARGKLVIPGYNSMNEEDDPSPALDNSHGTWCAGIAGAVGNNNIGICGVAPDCRILGVRVATENQDGTWNTDDLILANGILAAMDLGADVLSNSWSCGFQSDDIEFAIDVVKTEGRDGKGCVVCFASGNYEKAVEGRNGDRSVLFPGTLFNQVITVGACNQEGNWVGEKDDEDWESRYGPEVKLCAPGVHIRTTDLQGREGGGSGNYIFFRGTSAATPIVAGVAALILSKRPNMTAEDVERRLVETADFLDSDPPEKTGSGRVNADKAVP